MSKEHTYGNFLTYVLKAADKMNEDSIKKQLRRNKHKLYQLIQKERDKASKVIAIKEMEKYGFLL